METLAVASCFGTLGRSAWGSLIVSLGFLGARARPGGDFWTGKQGI